MVLLVFLPFSLPNTQHLPFTLGLNLISHATSHFAHFTAFHLLDDVETIQNVLQVLDSVVTL